MPTSLVHLVIAGGFLVQKIMEVSTLNTVLSNILTLQGKTKYTPSWVKVKYGAWYLSPRTWKARPTDEPLQDPKAQQDKTLSESKKKSQKLVSCTVFRVRTGPGKPGKSWNFIMAFSRTGKSWKKVTGPGKFWKFV